MLYRASVRGAHFPVLTCQERLEASFDASSARIQSQNIYQAPPQVLYIHDVDSEIYIAQFSGAQQFDVLVLIHVKVSLMTSAFDVCTGPRAELSLWSL